MTTSGLERIFKSFEIIECSPSKNSSLTQISYILADLHNYIQNVDLDIIYRDKINILNNNIHCFCEMVAKLNDELMKKVENQPQLFSKISPAVEITARKQL